MVGLRPHMAFQIHLNHFSPPRQTTACLCQQQHFGSFCTNHSPLTWNLCVVASRHQAVRGTTTPKRGEERRAAKMKARNELCRHTTLPYRVSYFIINVVVGLLLPHPSWGPFCRHESKRCVVTTTTRRRRINEYGKAK